MFFFIYSFLLDRNGFFNVFPGWKLVFKLFFQDGNGNLGPKKRLFHLFFLYGIF